MDRRLGTLKWTEYRGFDIAMEAEEAMFSRVDNSGNWEPEVYQWISRYTDPASTVVDIGAKYGIHTLNLRREVGPYGEVHCFEPNPVCRDALRRTIKRNAFDNVYVYGDAVGRTNRVVEHVETDENRSGSVSYISEGDWSYVTNEVPLTDVVPSPDVVKIDVEGAEYDIIPTLPLERIDTLIVETHDDVLSDDEMDEMMEPLEESGDVNWEKHRFVWNSDG